MKIVFLGTGTSVGVPMIGCHCPVCTSADPRNSRRRSSLYVEAAGRHVVVDTPPDFREQALAYRIPRVDAVLYTHSHADHIFGLDDLRRFNTIQGGKIPAYGSPACMADLHRIFDYIFDDPKIPGTYRPVLDLVEVTSAFHIGELGVHPLEVRHGWETTYGYRLDGGGRSVGYVPDCYEMPDAVVDRLHGVDVMILDALRYRPHITHLTVEDSLGLLKRIGAKNSYIIHMCHDLEHGATEKAMPDGVHVSYDGLTLEW